MHSFRDVGAFALGPSNADGGAEEGGEEDAAAAYPALPRGLDLWLGTRRTTGLGDACSCSSFGGNAPWGRRKTARSTKRSREWAGGGSRERTFEA